MVCFDQYELDYLRRIKFLHVEMPYCSNYPYIWLSFTIIYHFPIYFFMKG